MPIKYDRSKNVLHLYNKEISYLIHISNDKGLIHLYFGKYLKYFDLSSMLINTHYYCSFLIDEVENFKDRVTSKGQDIYDVDATIYCLRESHKGIIIGKGGNLLKRIASYARQDLEKMLDTKVNLKVWVKVKEDWLEKDNIVNKFKLK